MMLKTYTGQVVKPVGMFTTSGKMNGQQRKLRMFGENGSNRFVARDWLRKNISQLG